MYHPRSILKKAYEALVRNMAEHTNTTSTTASVSLPIRTVFAYDFHDRLAQSLSH